MIEAALKTGSMKPLMKIIGMHLLNVFTKMPQCKTGLRLGQDVEEAQGTMTMQTANSLFLLHRPEQVAAETMTMMITMTERMIDLHLPLEEVKSHP